VPNGSFDNQEENQVDSNTCPAAGEVWKGNWNCVWGVDTYGKNR